MRTKSLFSVIILSVFSFLAPQSQAALLAYESFNYSSGNLTGQSGGTGWGANWSGGGTNITFQTGSLDQVNGSPVTTAGNKAVFQTATASTRTLNTTLGADGTTAYFSLLMRYDGTSNTGNNNQLDSWGAFTIRNSANTSEIAFGNDYTNIVVGQGGGSSNKTLGGTFVGNTTYHMVLKVNFNAGNDTFSLFVNPTAGSEGAPALTFNNYDLGNSVNLIGITNGPSTPVGANWQFDEMRVATTWGDIVAIPEPSTYALLGAGMGLLWLVRRKARPQV